MRIFPLIAVVCAALALTGCQTVAAFLGSNDPCVAADNAHMSFVIAKAVQPKLEKVAAAEGAAYAAIKRGCADGSLTKVTLQEMVEAYVDAITEYRRIKG